MLEIECEPETVANLQGDETVSPPARKDTAFLVRDNVRTTLVRMAAPMLAGTFAMNAYNLTDTWFVSRLGTEPLAAMGFTFPVVMLISCLAHGLGTGVTALVSHAIGRGEHDRAARVTTHGIALAITVTISVCTIGYVEMDRIFALLGAGPDTLPLIRQYMGIWYAGAITMSLPMLGNGILISMGDSKSASAFMVIGTLLNTVLDRS